MDKLTYNKETRRFASIVTPLSKSSVSSKFNKTAQRNKNSRQFQSKLKFMVLARDLMTKKPIKKSVTANSEIEAISKFRQSYMKPSSNTKPIMVRAFKVPEDNKRLMQYAQQLSK